MTWRISSAGRWKPYRWQVCHSVPASEMGEEGLQHGNEWTDTCVSVFLCLREVTIRSMYDIYIATMLLSLLSRTFHKSKFLLLFLHKGTQCGPIIDGKLAHCPLAL